MHSILTLLILFFSLSLSAQNLTRTQAEQEAQKLADQWKEDIRSKYSRLTTFSLTESINAKIIPFPLYCPHLSVPL